MTEQELKQIKFKKSGHMTTSYEYMSSYISEDGKLAYCDHVPIKNGLIKGRPYRHYRINGKVYKNKRDFLKALENFSIQNT